MLANIREVGMRNYPRHSVVGDGDASELGAHDERLWRGRHVTGGRPEYVDGIFFIVCGYVITLCML